MAVTTAIAVTVFVVAYLLIATERVPKTAAAKTLETADKTTL